VPEQESLKRIATQIVEIDYDPAAHDILRKQLPGLEAYETPYRQIKEAERLIQPAREAMEKPGRR